MKQENQQLLGALSGAIAGFAAITPAAGYVNITAAIIIGFVASICAYYAVSHLKPRLGYDDSLDVFGIHGVCGIVGTIAVGIFATPLINSAIKGGLIAGNPGQIGIQLLAVLVDWCLCIHNDLIIGKVIDMTIGLRVEKKHEVQGLDINLHEESGYRLS